MNFPRDARSGGCATFPSGPFRSRPPTPCQLVLIVRARVSCFRFNSSFAGSFHFLLFYKVWPITKRRCSITRLQTPAQLCDHMHGRHSDLPVSTVKEEIIVGEKFRTFPSKTFRMEFNFVLSNHILANPTGFSGRIPENHTCYRATRNFAKIVDFYRNPVTPCEKKTAVWHGQRPARHRELSRARGRAADWTATSTVYAEMRGDKTSRRGRPKRLL